MGGKGERVPLYLKENLLLHENVFHVYVTGKKRVVFRNTFVVDNFVLLLALSLSFCRSPLQTVAVDARALLRIPKHGLRNPAPSGRSPKRMRETHI
jgi:hypothetical protein